MKKRRFISIIAAVICAFSMLTTNASAIYENSSHTYAKIPGAVVYTEQTAWYYRMSASGRLEKRLWSLTYERWLTDWMPVGSGS